MQFPVNHDVQQSFTVNNMQTPKAGGSVDFVNVLNSMDKKNPQELQQNAISRDNQSRNKVDQRKESPKEPVKMKKTEKSENKHVTKKKKTSELDTVKEKVKALVKKVKDHQKSKTDEQEEVLEVEEELLSLLDLLQMHEDSTETKDLKDTLKKLLSFIKKKASAKETGTQKLQAGDPKTDVTDDQIKEVLDKLGDSLKKTTFGKNNNGRKTKVKKSGKVSEEKIKTDETMPQIMVNDQRKNDLKKLGPKVRVKKRVFQTKEAKQASQTESQVGVTSMVKNSGTASTGGETLTAADVGMNKNRLKGAEKFTKKTGVKEPRRVFSQLVERAKITHKSGMSEMKLQLKPKALGRIRMRLILKDGQVSAKLTIANQDLRQFIGDNLDELSRDLKNAGIMLTDVEVNQNNDKSGFADLFSKDQQNKDSIIRTAGKDGEPVATNKQVSASDSLIDLVA